MKKMDIMKRINFNKGRTEQCVFILYDKMVKKLVVLFLFMQKRLLDYYFLGSVICVTRCFIVHYAVGSFSSLSHSLFKRHLEESFINYSLT